MNVGELLWNWIHKNNIQVHKKKKISSSLESSIED